MKNGFKLSLISLCLLSIGMNFALLNENTSEPVKADTTSQFRSHQGRYLKNPLAIQVPDDVNEYELIKNLYNAPGYATDKGNYDSPFIHEFKTLLANNNDVFNPYFMQTFKTTLNSLSLEDDDVDKILLSFEATDNPSEAITLIFATVYNEPFTADYHEEEFTRDVYTVKNDQFVLIEDVKFKPVPAYNFREDKYYPVADFNATSGGAYINLYYTTDPRAGYPIQEFKIVYENFANPNHSDIYKNYIRKVTNGEWSDCNFDDGVGGDHPAIYIETNYYTTPITVHTPENTTRIDYFARMHGNPHKYYPDECRRYPGYDCKWYFSPYYNIKYILTDDYNTSGETDLYGRYEKTSTATTEEQGNFFANFLMKINDSSFVGAGIGKCTTDGLYIKAKENLQNNLDDAGRKYIIDTYNDSSKSNTDVYKAYQRLQSWATANGETITIDSNGAISFSNKTSFTILNINETSSITIIALSVLLLAGAYTLVLIKFKKKKHN